jgi:hypothetical protein
MKTKITKAMLSNQILNKSRSGELLYCLECGSEFSANSGDYFMQPDNYVFMCCNEPMILAKKQIDYIEQILV